MVKALPLVTKPRRGRVGFRAPLLHVVAMSVVITIVVLGPVDALAGVELARLNARHPLAVGVDAGSKGVPNMVVDALGIDYGYQIDMAWASRGS